MSLHQVRDEFLACQASRGDERAFGELARRYRPLIVSVSKHPPARLQYEDLRQEALIGLFAACRTTDPARRGRFAGLARACVRYAVLSARANARARKQLVLTHAAHDTDDVTRQLERRAAAPAPADPLVVVELCEELRRHARTLQRRRLAPGGDLRRRYSDEQRSGALALIAAGQTLQQAAWAVGASSQRVSGWIKQAGQARLAGRRRYTPAEIGHALALVERGASLRQAGNAVGATNATVLRWRRKAA